LRAQARQGGLRNGLLDRGGLTAVRQSLESYLEGQKAYHQVTAARFRDLNERLAMIGKWLFFFSLAISVTIFIVQLFRYDAIAPSAQRWLLVLSAGLPALGAACYGVRVIGDFDGAAARSARMVTQLDGLISKLKLAPCQFDTLRETCHRAADVLQGDVASWRLVVESRELEMPG